MLAFFKNKKQSSYDPVQSSNRTSEDANSFDEKSSNDEEPFLEDNAYGYLKQSSRRGSSWKAVPWMISTAILSLITALLGFRVYSLGHGVYETGFNTDFQNAVNLIEVVETRFTTPPLNVMRPEDLSRWDPTVPRYVGIPAPEVDQAWNKLTGPFMPLKVDEVIDIPGAALQNGRYWATTTAQHTLHCLNHLRKSIYLEYYPDLSPDAVGEDYFWSHLNHCVDIIRQSLICTADITPVPLGFNEEAGIYGADTERVHTCRNYDPLITYFKARGANWRDDLEGTEH